MDAGANEVRRFLLANRIGSGGFGDVYRATMVSTGGVESEVAIKVLHEDLAPNSQALQRLRDEGKMLGLIRHPSIVKVIDLVELDGRAALVTEYIEGTDIGICFRHGGVEPRALCEVIAQVAAALEAAWSTATTNSEALKLVHRDIKPENIRMGRHGNVKLLDFGIAKAGGFRREAKTEAGDVVGSYRYMAPERFNQTDGNRPESDIYSLGAVLYEGLAGKRLFSGSDLRAQVALASDDGMHDEFMRKRINTLDPSSTLRALLLACLAYDPRLRPSAARLSELCDDLADAQPGKNLRQWCRKWEWPPEDAAPGPLTGRRIVQAHTSTPPVAGKRENITLMVFDDDPTIRDVSMVPPPAPPPFQPAQKRAPPEEPTRPIPTSERVHPVKSSQTPRKVLVAPPAKKSRGSGFEVMLGATTLVVVILLGAIGVGVLGAMVWYSNNRVVVAAPAEPLDIAATDGMPEEPEDEVEPPAPAPAPRAARPSPAVADPEPEEEEPSEPETGVFAVDAKIPVVLRNDAGAHGAGAIPIGAFQLMADFGDGFEQVRPEPVVVLPGSSVSAKCNSLKRTCELTQEDPG